MNGKRSGEPVHRSKTFDELFDGHRLTRDERRALVWHLAAIRMCKLVETLESDPRDVLREAAEGGGDAL